MVNKPMVWMDGKMVEQDKAYVPLMTRALHYGSGVFEGIRLYDTKKGRAIFRLEDHIVHLFNSSKILDMKIPYTVEGYAKRPAKWSGRPRRTSTTSGR